MDGYLAQKKHPPPQDHHRSLGPVFLMGTPPEGRAESEDVEVQLQGVRVDVPLPSEQGTP